MNLIGCRGIFLKHFLLRNHKGGEAKTWHACLGHKPVHKLCFFSGRIRTLVAVATYISHRLIMGKVEIDKPLGIFEFFYRHVY